MVLPKHELTYDPEGLTTGSGCVYSFRCLFHIIVFLLQLHTVSGNQGLEGPPLPLIHFSQPPTSFTAFKISLEERPDSVTSSIVFQD